MKLFRKTLVMLAMAVTVSACSSGGSDDSDPSLTQSQRDNRDLFNYLKTDYFWNESLPASINDTAWATMPDAMNGLKAPEDKFSFVMTNAEYADFVASVFFGYGFSHQTTAANDGLRIRYTFRQGSAYQLGMRRGDTITHVGGKSIAEALQQQTPLADLFGPNENGFSTTVRFVKPNGEVVEGSMTKSQIVANTVMAAQVKDVTINNAPVKVGYLVFDSFKESSAQELNTAFDGFVAQGVKELILDLRYNSGGRIAIAEQLSKQIAGRNVENQTFVKYVHNNLRSNRDQTVTFNSNSSEQSLNLDRVVVLTSGTTCSASELVINALNPFIDVVVVGDTTCGKPTGMYPTEINDWTVFAINFQTQNAANFGDYFDGLPADCKVAETIPGDWGVETEAMLAEGIYYLQNGSCSTRVQARSVRVSKPVDFSHGLYRMKNVL